MIMMNLSQWSVHGMLHTGFQILCSRCPSLSTSPKLEHLQVQTLSWSGANDKKNQFPQLLQSKGFLVLPLEVAQPALSYHIPPETNMHCCRGIDCIWDKTSNCPSSFGNNPHRGWSHWIYHHTSVWHSLCRCWYYQLLSCTLNNSGYVPFLYTYIHIY